MPLRLDIKRQLISRSDRVKAVDFHPTEPWLLAALYNGNVYIWNYETQQLVKTFEVSELPVRTAKFVSRKSWIIAGSDDMYLRVFNYNTHEKVIGFEAHADYIRSIAVHPTQPYVLSSSDDFTIKLWDWENAWKNIMVFEGHTHYIMQVVFNPKDTNTFASASLDRTIKVWSLGSSVPNYTLEGHEKGVNCVEYYHGSEKPFLVSGADDHNVKIWDYQNKTCVQTLVGHTENVSMVCFHPKLPIIISGSEDGTVRFWHVNTYRLEETLNYGMERVWALSYLKSSNNIAIGYDEGVICIKIGREEPAISMDNSGKIIWANHNDIKTANIKTAIDDSTKDGEQVSLSIKDLGNCELYPNTLKHSPNGRFVVICGDGEYIIFTALAWRNKNFGSALDFVWSSESNEYAIRESSSKIKLYKNFKEKNVSINANYSIDTIFGGSLLSVKGGNSLNFYDWETGVCVRRIEVVAKNVFWADSDLVAITSNDSFYLLRFNRVAYQQALEKYASNISEEGVEEAFEFLSEVNETVETGIWVGDCFIYTNSANRLNYVVGGQVNTISHFDKNMYLLGYIQKDNRIYLCDKDVNVTSYSFPLSVIEYQTAILRGDLESAELILPTVPMDQRNKVARFLESQDMKEMALIVSSDPAQRFDLAIQLNHLNIALEIVKELDQVESWKTLGEAALNAWKFDLVEECFSKAGDYENLLLFYQITGNKKALSKLGHTAEKNEKNNLAFICYLVCQETQKCVDLLIKSDRLPEAALFARTYIPSEIPRIVDLWKTSLKESKKNTIAESISSPVTNPELFPNYENSLNIQELIKSFKENVNVSSNDYPKYKDSLNWDLINDQEKVELIKQLIEENKTTVEKDINITTTDYSNDSQNHLSHAVSFANSPEIVDSDNKANDMAINSHNSAVYTHNYDNNLSVEEFDTMSHLSMEVNTTGTGSIRGEEFDDFSSMADYNSTSGISDTNEHNEHDQDEKDSIKQPQSAKSESSEQPEKLESSEQQPEQQPEQPEQSEQLEQPEQSEQPEDTQE